MLVFYSENIRFGFKPLSKMYPTTALYSINIYEILVEKNYVHTFLRTSNLEIKWLILLLDSEC